VLAKNDSSLNVAIVLLPNKNFVNTGRIHTYTLLHIQFIHQMATCPEGNHPNSLTKYFLQVFSFGAPVSERAYVCVIFDFFLLKVS